MSYQGERCILGREVERHSHSTDLWTELAHSYLWYSHFILILISTWIQIHIHINIHIDMNTLGLILFYSHSYHPSLCDAMAWYEVTWKDTQDCLRTIFVEQANSWLKRVMDYVMNKHIILAQLMHMNDIKWKRQWNDSITWTKIAKVAIIKIYKQIGIHLCHVENSISCLSHDFKHECIIIIYTIYPSMQTIPFNNFMCVK